MTCQISAAVVIGRGSTRHGHGDRKEIEKRTCNAEAQADKELAAVPAQPGDTKSQTRLDRGLDVPRYSTDAFRQIYCI